jgi:hypothetical protein|tara:strand:- start:35165 stop:35302 length:138 start_codon:yes stop_codon:yes gene_type:complete
MPAVFGLLSFFGAADGVTMVVATGAADVAGVDGLAEDEDEETDGS